MLNVVHAHYVPSYTEIMIYDGEYPAINWPNGVKEGDEIGFNYILGADKNNKEINKLRYFSGFFFHGFLAGKIKFYSLEDIPREKDPFPYVFPIHIFSLNFFTKYSTTPLHIPEQIIKDIRTNKAKLLFITDEGDEISDIKINTFKYQANYFNIPLKNIIYISCNTLVEDILNRQGMTGIYYNPWQCSVSRVLDSIQYIDNIKSSIIKKDIRKKKMLCFNRNSHAYRAYLVNRMIELNLLEDSIITYA